jgi:hypothetical protein
MWQKSRGKARFVTPQMMDALHKRLQGVVEKKRRVFSIRAKAEPKMGDQ